MDIKAIKERGKAAFKANYWRCVLVAFILTALVAGTAGAASNSAQNTVPAGDVQELNSALDSLPESAQLKLAAAVLGGLTVIMIVSILLQIFVFNPLQVGACRFFKKNTENPGASAGILKEGFGNYGHTFGTLFLRDLFLFLWSCLFIIPGFIKSYSYMLVPYLIKDNPNLSAKETIALSKKMMEGHKMDAFKMDLSFIGWFLLGAITANLVNTFWTNPYHESARAGFYLALLDEQA